MTALRVLESDHGHDDEESERSIDAAAVADIEFERRQPDLTELGNAQRFARMQQGRLRYVHAWRRWLAWDGRRWSRDESEAEIAAAKRVVYALRAEVAALLMQASRADELAAGRADELAKFATKSATNRGLRAAVALAQSDPALATSASALDADPWLLNVANGTIDLRTGRIRSHDPADLITQLAPVEFDPRAECPTWDAFLMRVLPDPAVRDWVHRFCGYSISGDVGEQVLAFFLGCGANGKSTLLRAVQDVLGDYAA